MATRYPEYDQEIIELYALGFSLREIAELVHWSQRFVRNRLLENRIKLRKRGGRRPYIPYSKLKQARDLYLIEKKDTPEIAEIMGVRSETVLRYLRRTDAPMRRSKRSTHCIHGHEFTPENTVVMNGKRRCVICKRATGRRQAARRSARTVG